MDVKNFGVFICKVICDATFRILIFFSFLCTVNDGQFSTKIVVAYYYGVVWILVCWVNIPHIQNDEDIWSLRLWIGNNEIILLYSFNFNAFSGILLNSLLSLITFNSYDFWSMFGKVDETLKYRRWHRSTFWKQLTYNTIIFAVHIM